MKEEKDKEENEENKIQSYNSTFPPLEDLGPTEAEVSGHSIPAVSGALLEGYADLRGTFNVRQRNIVQRRNYEKTLTTVVELLRA